MRCLLLLSLLTTSCFSQELPSSVLSAAGHSFPAGDAPQIRVEVRYLSAPPDILSELKRNSLIRSAPQDAELTLPAVTDAELADAGGIRLVSSTSVVERQLPVFVETLSHDETSQLMQKALGNKRTNLMLAPKVTLFNRQVAQIQDGSIRPFVVGVKPHGDGYQQQTLNVEEGTHLVLRAVVQRNGGVRLDLRARLSAVEDAGLIEAGPANVVLQVPEVQRHDLQLSAVVPVGASLAICGLQKTTTTTATGVPLMRGVPYVSRLFKNTATGTMTEELMLLISPKVLTPESSGE